MLLSILIRLTKLKSILFSIGFFYIYYNCLKVASRGFFFAWAVIFCISLVLPAVELAFEFIDNQSDKMGIHGIGIAAIIILSVPINVLVSVICIDCFVAGLRARNQFALGSIFSSKSYDEKQAELLSLIQEVNDESQKG